MRSVATSRGITSPLCHPQNLYSINSLSHRFELGEEDGCGTLECNAVPLLCVTMASSGFAATDRQLCQPLVAASSPGALAWLQTLMCPAGTTACCTHSTLLHTLSLVLSLGPGPGPRTRPGHCAQYSPLTYCPCWLLASPFSLSVGSQGTSEASNIFLFLWSKEREPRSTVHLLYLMCFSRGAKGRKPC